MWSRIGSPTFLRRQSMPRSAPCFLGFRDPAHRGYLAGIIDGEGAIVKPPHLTIIVGTTDRKLALRLRELAGGNVTGPYLYGRTKVFGNKVCVVKPQYHWTVDSRFEVYRLLKTVLPYLVIKAKLAIKTIAYIEQRFGWAIT